MTIAIDCRHIDSSGIGVYLAGILPFLLQSDHKYSLLGNPEKLISYISNKNVNIVECNIKPFSIKELFFFPRIIAKQINKADLFFSPSFNIPCGIKIPVFTTIHDIIFADMPELVSKTGLAIRMWFYRRAYKKSKKIFTVSEFSKSRIEHHLGKTKPIIVTHSAIQPMFLEYKANAQNRQKTETIVFIGNIKKHKGLDTLLDSFLLAKNEGMRHKLIIIGSRDNFRSSDNEILQKIDSLGTDTVIFTGFISNEQLMDYLSSASLLVQPSLYEGFGLPPLEAMVLGTPALISDIPVFKEIYEDYPVTFFRAGDPNDLKQKMMGLLFNQTDNNISLTENLVEKYTFKKVTELIMGNFLIKDFKRVFGGLCIILCMLLFFVGCTGNPVNIPFRADSSIRITVPAEHLVFIGFDGWGGVYVPNADMPTVKRMMANGSSSLEARSVMPCISWPNWSSLFFGTPPKQRTSNPFPSIFTVVKNSGQINTPVFFHEWGKLDEICSDETAVKIRIGSNLGSVQSIAAYFIENKPVFTAISFDQPDYTGHRKMWGSEAYYAKLTELDGYIAIIEEAVREAGVYDSTVFVLSADHGGTFYLHWLNTDKHRNIPLVFFGRGIKEGYNIPSPISICDIAPTMAAILGLEAPPEWTGQALRDILIPQY
ncbi:MAG: glycosyltransferase [Treponema sp.]|nr:glycosyltransferase [Treponema sp.]